jgi:dihydropteroate synthase
MFEWHLSDRILKWERRPLVMGIVNVTPDSFSDGGQHATTESAIAHGLQLLQDGADVLDIGGESTRPGAEPVSLADELRRVVPVVTGLAAQTKCPLSVDTSKAEVARRCLEAGAHVINDVTALTGDPEMRGVVRQHRCGLVLMHMQGTPQTMQQNPHYEDVVAEVGQFFAERLQFAVAGGIAPERVVLDPGIGFGKKGKHNLELLAGLAEFQRLGRPICLGVSRKGFIGQIVQRPVEQRLAGSLAAVLFAQSQQAVQIVRVHDVRETRDALEVFAAIQESEVRNQKSEVRSELTSDL